MSDIRSSNILPPLVICKVRNVAFEVARSSAVWYSVPGWNRVWEQTNIGVFINREHVLNSGPDFPSPPRP
jgi:hypothetical protein